MNKVSRSHNRANTVRTSCIPGRIHRYIFLLTLVLLLCSIYYFQLHTLISLEYLKQQKTLLLRFVRQYYTFAVFAYLGLYWAIVALSIPGATPLSLLGGFLFGIMPGSLFILLGASVGACLAFLLVRYVVGAALQKKYVDQLSGFNKELKRSGAFYLLALRLIPIFPFFLVNIFAGLTTTSLQTFFFTTLFGMIPASLVFAFAGKQLQAINNISNVFSSKLIVALCLLGLLVLVPVVYRNLKN